LFTDERSVIRLDMSEYADRQSVQRLIGAAPGAVGYEEGGQLTEAVRRRPFSMILLDEIDKAHPEVLNVLLQVLEDGRLTDSHGRVADFRNTVLVMTSQLSASDPLPPEIAARIDRRVSFHPLTPVELDAILTLQLRAVERRLEGRGLRLELTEAARAHLTGAGSDPAWGARPLRRAIADLLLDPLATGILSGRYAEGDTIRIDAQAGGLHFDGVRPRPADDVASTKAVGGSLPKG
jgi:ATP-dependent Clp protease ATP-binding subunit ClpB